MDRAQLDALAAHYLNTSLDAAEVRSENSLKAPLGGIEDDIRRPFVELRRLEGRFAAQEAYGRSLVGRPIRWRGSLRMR